MTKHAMRNAMALAASAALALLAADGATAQRVECAAGQYYGPTDNEIFPKTPRLDCTFGQTVNMAIARQIIDKDAGVKHAAKRAAGMDGVAAKEAIDRYQKSFRSPEPNGSAFTIGVTGNQSSGMTP